MKLVSWSAVAIALTLALPSSASAQNGQISAAQSRFPIQTRHFANGLRVIISPQHDTARAAVWVTYATGSRDDPEGYHGLAHMLEHMMFQQTRHVREDQFAQLLEHAGATDINATTSPDRTDYYEVVPSEQLPLALWLESDRMAFLLDGVTTASVDSQRRVVLNEFALRVPSSVLARQVLSEALYPAGHPYRSLTEDADDLRAIGAPEVTWFFDRCYAPHAATIVIAGDVDPDAGFALVEHYFGSVRDRDAAARPHLSALAPRASERVITIYAPRSYDTVTVVWNTPAYFGRGDAELDVLTGMLAGDDESPMRAQLLRTTRATSVEAIQRSRELGSEFSIGVEYSAGGDGATILAEIDRQLSALQTGMIDHDEFEDWQHTMIRRVLNREEDVLTRAAALASYAGVVDDGDPFARDADRYRAVTPESLQHAAQRLRTDRRVVVWERSDQRAPRSGRVVSITNSGH